ncbi:MAG TPA: DUF5667 domain-containing protein, partial [Chloroflexota bacterium]|nr:DUF5667 domain-containing protein [Chloroflexota bacterium]
MTNYLVELDRRGWDLESFLAEHPEVSAALGELLRTADRVRRASPPAPSEAFRLRSRRRLAVAMARPAPRRRWYRIGSHWRDYRPLVAPVAAGLLIVLGLGGVWSASASALPSSPLYSAKLVMEQAALVTAITPDRRAVVHLAIAQERLREAAIEQERGDLTVAQELIQGSDAEVARAQDVLQASSPPTAVATAVASTVAEVNDERRQVAMRVGARPTAARFTKVLDQQAVAATAEPHGTAVVAAEPVRGSDSAASGTGGSHDSEVSGSPGDGSSRLRGHSNNAGATGDGGTENWTAAKIVLTPTPTPETKSGASAVQPADSLLQTLLIQAKAGDPASQETA